jgi:hypothetical protein
MDRSLLVRIFVPTREEGVGNTGTGYPVGRDLVLTARHVVEPPDRDPKSPIQILWYDYPNAGPDDGWYRLADDCIIWKAQGDLDAALLRCPRPPEVRNFGLVSRERPRDGMDWASAGFPRASLIDEVTHHASFGGKMFGMPQTASYFELDVSAPPATEKDWSGASGMPICHQNSRVVLGVAIKIPKKFGAHKLHATPTWKLLDDPDFRKAVGYDEQQGRLDRFRRRLVQVLTPSPRAIVAIVDKSGLTDGQGTTVQATADAVAEQLLRCHLIDGVAAIRKAYDFIEEEREYGENPELKGAAEVLRRAVQLVAPCLYDDGLVGAIRAHKGDQDITIFELPCFFPTVAEIVMAGVDNRGTEFLPRESEIHYPEGRRQLPAPPETGIGEVAKQSEAIREGLTRKFSPGGWSSLRTQIDDYMYRRFVDPGGAVDQQREARIRNAAIELKNLSTRSSYYLLYRLPADEHARRELEEGLRALKRDYQPLIIFGLTGDSSVETRERADFGPFSLMLPVRS